MSWIYLYGSVAAGRSDNDSDIDYLVVVEKSSEIDKKVERAKAIAYDKYLKEPTISIYYLERLRQYYETGALFAWHLYDESILIESDSENDLLRDIGAPRAYINDKSDLELFTWMVNSIDTSVEYLEHNAELEAGYFFTAMRNIGIVLSAKAGRNYDYSTGAILRCSPPVPISVANYNLYRSIKSRRQSGAAGFPFDQEEFRRDVLSAKLWIKNLDEVNYVQQFL